MKYGIIKKTAAVIISAVMLFCGCSAEVTEEEAGMNIITPPSEGWTDETISSVLYIEGQNFTIPTDYESLGEEWKWRSTEETGSFDVQRYNKHIIVNESSNHAFSWSKKILNVMVASGDENTAELVINGIGLGASPDEVISALGEPDIKDDYAYFYENANSSDYAIAVMFYGEEERTVCLISIYSSLYYKTKV